MMVHQNVAVGFCTPANNDTSKPVQRGLTSSIKLTFTSTSVQKHLT